MNNIIPGVCIGISPILILIPVSLWDVSLKMNGKIWDIVQYRGGGIIFFKNVQISISEFFKKCLNVLSNPKTPAEAELIPAQIKFS